MLRYLFGEFYFQAAAVYFEYTKLKRKAQERRLRVFLFHDGRRFIIEVDQLVGVEQRIARILTLILKLLMRRLVRTSD